MSEARSARARFGARTCIFRVFRRGSSGRRYGTPHPCLHGADEGQHGVLCCTTACTIVLRLRPASRDLFSLGDFPMVPKLNRPQGAEMVKGGLCYALASDDWDALTFGAPKVVRHLMSSTDKNKVLRWAICNGVQWLMLRYWGCAGVQRDREGSRISSPPMPILWPNQFELYPISSLASGPWVACSVLRQPLSTGRCLAFGRRGTSCSFDCSLQNPITEIDQPAALSELGLTHEQFIDLCILCGCDYCGRIPGIGPVRALEKIKVRQGRALAKAMCRAVLRSVLPL